MMASYCLKLDGVALSAVEAITTETVRLDSRDDHDGDPSPSDCVQL